MAKRKKKKLIRPIRKHHVRKIRIRINKRTRISKTSRKRRTKRNTSISKKPRRVVLKTNPPKAIPYIIQAKTIGGGRMYYNATRQSFDTNRNVATQMTLKAAKREAQRIHLMLPFKIESIGVHKAKGE